MNKDLIEKTLKHKNEYKALINALMYKLAIESLNSNEPMKLEDRVFIHGVFKSIYSNNYTIETSPANINYPLILAESCKTYYDNSPGHIKKALEGEKWKEFFEESSEQESPF